MFRILIFLFAIPLYSQSTEYKYLEDSIYKLNNNQNYESSISLLNGIINKSSVSNEDKYFANLYLSYTYKRLYDYQSVFLYLDAAEKWGKKTSKSNYYTTNILCQKALAKFDLQKYIQADSLMKILASTNYQFLNEEYVSKINMQEAYLLFLNKEYVLSEKKYEAALALLKKSSPCDLPMIYAKQMELYDVMGKRAKLKLALEQSLASADSCHIMKYSMYTYQTYANIEIENHGLSPLMGKVDSLERAYNAEEKLRALKQSEKIYQDNINAEKIKNKNRQIILLGIILLGLIGAITGLLYFMKIVRRQKDLITQQNNINENLVTLISHDIREPLLNTSILLKDINSLDPNIFISKIEISKQIKAVNDLLLEIMQIKKINTKYNKGSINIKPIVDQLVNESATTLESKNIKIIDQTHADTTLPGTKELITIILRNAIDNAIKFSLEDSEIKIVNYKNGISIQDNGIGIENEKLAKLFHEPTKSEEGTHGEQGNGVGLYLLKQLAEYSGIKLEIDSVKGKGTKLHIIFRPKL